MKSATRIGRVLASLAWYAVVTAVLALPLDAARAQQPGWTTDTRLAPAQPTPKGREPANTTVVPLTRPASGARESHGPRTLRLTAHLTDDGQAIDQGLVWRIFQEPATPTPASKPKLVRTLREATPAVTLSPGEYVVIVSFGRAHLTKRVKVGSDAPQAERFVINAGGLRVNALLPDGKPAPPMAVSFDLFSGEADQLGGRQRIMSGARPGLIIRLNAGIYHVVSTYGDANATVQSDVTVEAGKLTEVSIAHTGAAVTFKLVSRRGGEAQSGAQWVIMTPDGQIVKETAGALPTHVLAAGHYIVSARHAGRTFRRDFAVESGEPMQVEVIMQ